MSKKVKKDADDKEDEMFNTALLLNKARAIAEEVFGDKATALHALEVHDRLEANDGAEELADALSDLKSAHAGGQKIFADRNTPETTLQLFGMIIDFDLDEEKFFDDLGFCAGQVREVFGDDDAHDPAVVLGLYDREFGMDLDFDEDEDEDDDD